MQHASPAAQDGADVRVRVDQHDRHRILACLQRAEQRSGAAAGWPLDGGVRAE